MRITEREDECGNKARRQMFGNNVMLLGSIRLVLEIAEVTEKCTLCTIVIGRLPRDMSRWRLIKAKISNTEASA